MHHVVSFFFIPLLFLCFELTANDQATLLKTEEISGSGTITQENRQLSQFNSLNIQGSFDIIVYQDETSSIEIEADDNIIPFIMSTVSSETLNIKAEKDNTFFLNLSPTIRPKIIIRTTSLKNLFASGNSSIVLNSIDNEELKLDLSGSSEIIVRGKSKNVTAHAAGSSKIHASALQADTVTFKVSGSGKVSIHADKTLNGKISGSGMLEYSGKPSKKEIDITGSGKLSPA
jgi:hypothetical protein